MTAPRFASGFTLSFSGLELEVVPRGVRNERAVLDAIVDDVLVVAARSRGWEGPEALDAFRAHFKLGPLYDANGLVLLRREGRLVGLAGSINDWDLGDRSVVHLCSLGLLPEAQGKGLLELMTGMVLYASLREAGVAERHARGRAFLTAITQSPYLVGYLVRRFADLGDAMLIYTDPSVFDETLELALRPR